MASGRLYLRVEASLPRHPKVLRLAESFDLPPDVGPDLVVAFLLRWWGYCAEFGSGGKPADIPRSLRDEFSRPLYKYSERDGDDEPPDLDQLLREVGLMDPDGNPHDWQDYTGKLLALRAADAERKRHSTDVPGSIPGVSLEPPPPIVQHSTAQHKEQPSATEKPSRATWLSPYLDLWKTRLGGLLAPGQAARYLKPLEAEHGQTKVLAYLGNFLAEYEGPESRFASIGKFATTFGQWSGNGIPKRASTLQDRNFARIEQARAEMEADDGNG